MTLPSFESGNHAKDNRAWLLLFGLDNLVWLSFFICDIKHVMKKPQTQLGKQLARILTRHGDEFELVESSKEYDTLQIEVDRNKLMNFLCHDYPGLAYGILINTKTAYTIPETMSMDSLIQAINKANLKSTSVITAVERHNDSSFITLHFKTFIHLERNIKFARILESAVDLHLQEIDEVISPHFKSIDKEGV